MSETAQLLPPPLVHALRARSYMRLFRMVGNPRNRGFGRYLRQRIRDVVARERTLVEKAITVAYLGSYLVDHIIYAEIQACRILENRDLSEEEEHRLWEKNYGDVIVRLAHELPDGAAVLDKIAALENYGRLPPSLHTLRGQHWSLIARVLSGQAGGGGYLHNDLRLMERVDFLLASARPARRKARDICLTASMIADILCWSEHVPWSEAYQEVMIDLYPRLFRHAEVIEEIIQLK